MTYLQSYNSNEALSVNIMLDKKTNLCYSIQDLLVHGSTLLHDDNLCRNKELYRGAQNKKVNGLFAFSCESGLVSGTIY